MGSTNKTAHYELPQFVANDKPSWLGDVNQAMEAIDTGIFGAKSSADGAQTTANNAVAGVQTANTRMDGMQTQLDTVATQANQTATAVNQHTASIATNSANINTLNSRMGSTDISSIGDGTVTGAIQAISGGGGGGASNVRWNATTDRFEVLKNGNWVQSIRAFVNSIAVFVAGIFGITMDNGTYNPSTAINAEPFTLSNNVIESNSLQYNSLVSDAKIDFINYSAVKVKYIAGTDPEQTLTLNVSNVSDEYYLAIGVDRRTSGANSALTVLLSPTKENYSVNPVTHQEAYGTGNVKITITEITVE